MKKALATITTKIIDGGRNTVLAIRFKGLRGTYELAAGDEIWQDNDGGLYLGSRPELLVATVEDLHRHIPGRSTQLISDGHCQRWDEPRGSKDTCGFYALDESTIEVDDKWYCSNCVKSGGSPREILSGDVRSCEVCDQIYCPHCQYERDICNECKERRDNASVSSR